MDRLISEERVLALILAGGRGSRLGPLTDDCSKPALPFGKLNVISFVISNCVNSKIIDHAYVLTQYKQQGIIEILAKLDPESPLWGKFIRPLPAQQMRGTDWYLGSGDACHQNRELIANDPAEFVLVAAADHVYKCDYRGMLAALIGAEADVIVSGMFMDVHEAAGKFGVMVVDFETNRIRAFKEKPAHPKPVRDNKCVASQGFYIFRKEILLAALDADHRDNSSDHDFGKDILPEMLKTNKVIFYDHATNVIKNEKGSYWRDVGDVDAYHAAMMDLVAIDPILSVYNKAWPIIPIWDYEPMYKANELGHSNNADYQFMAAGGSVTTKARCVYMVVLGRAVYLEENCAVVDSILFDNVSVGRDASLNRTIVKKGIVIPPGCVIGQSIEDDDDRQIFISEGGIRVVHDESRL